MKPLILIVVLTGFAVSAFSLEFVVAPMVFIDETTDTINQRNNFHTRLVRELGNTETGLQLRFRVSDSLRFTPPQSVGDAIVLARTERADYVIYGFFTRREQTIQGTLRLLDYERREIIAHFHAMDSNEREEELVRDLAEKIFRFVQETYNIITIPDPPAFTHIQFPISLGYWQPVDGKWLDLLFGLVKIEGGVQLIPSDYVFVLDGFSHYFSLGVNVSYRFGIGNQYDAWNHSFSVNAPILLHRKLNEQNEAYAGFGLMYSFDLLYIKRPYEDPSTELFGAAGFVFNGGWIFKPRENLFIFAEIRMEVRFYDNPMFNIAPSAGIILRRFTQEVIKKW